MILGIYIPNLVAQTLTVSEFNRTLKNFLNFRQSIAGYNKLFNISMELLVF